MNKSYYFGIQNSQVGPLDEQSIAARIHDGSITKDTLAWCEGMDAWRPAQQIPELMVALGARAGGGAPPPLPSGKVVPPELPSVARTAMSSLGEINEQAYRFIVWCYRPWRGKVSPLRRWVDADPRNRALPVAVGTGATIVLIVVLWFSTMAEQKETAQQAESPNSPNVMQGGMPSQADLMARQRAWQDAHTYSQGVIDDAYKYRRDTQDRMDETYRRATYDWYDKDR